MMYGIPLGTTRAALLVESKDKDGNVVIEVHYLNLLSTRYDISRNVFDGDHGLVVIEGVVRGQGVWHGPMPDAEQEAIEPTQLAIESNEIVEAEIVEDEDDYEWGRS